MLPNLPTELLLDVFAFLTVQEIRNIRLVSRSLDALIHENAESIYRAAALLHRFIFSNDTLEDIAWLDYPPGAEAQASWKDLCRRRILLERSWNGDGTVVEGSLPGVVPPAKVRSISIDEEHHTLLALYATGEIIVTALESSQRLWKSLPLGTAYMPITTFWISGPYLVCLAVPWDVAPAAVLIWRRSPFSARVTQERGRYAPHATLEFPENHLSWGGGCIRGNSFAVPVRAPTGAIEVWIYDIARPCRLRHISLAKAREGTWAPAEEQQILSMALSETHLCVCFVQYALIVPFGDDELAEDAYEGGTMEHRSPAIIFPPLDMARDPGSVMRATAFQLTPTGEQAGTARARGLATKLNLGTPFGERAIASDTAGMLPAETALRSFSLYPLRGGGAGEGESQALVIWGATPATLQRFNDGCFSPSGRHLALVNEFGVLYIVHDFVRVAQGLVSWAKITTRITFPYGAKYLAWEYEERLVLQTAGDIWVVNLDPSYHGVVQPLALPGGLSSVLPPSFPHARVYQLAQFSDQRGRMVRGLPQVRVTRAGLWAVGNAALLARRVELGGTQANADDDVDVGSERAVCFVDFSVSQ